MIKSCQPRNNNNMTVSVKKEYKSPVAERVPLLMDQSLCQASILKYVIIAEDNPIAQFDDDSD